ncbi:hypothetical protein ACVWYN_001629 [Pedobacter sp. UYP24]
MGKYKNGILGAFSGKIGAVIGASWRGIDYMRSLPRISNKPATEKQLAQRMKMILLRGFLLGIEEIIEICFQNYVQTSAMNGALSYNMTHSVTGTYPDMCVDFPNLIISKGDLHGAWSPSVVSTESKSIDFNWTNGPFNNLRAATDQVLLVLYCPEEKGFFLLTDGGLREAGTIRLMAPEEFWGKNVHCYISFYSKELEFASTNEYLGEVTIIE